MTFAPILPLAGYAGWTFLKRTLPAQQAAYAAAPELKRDEAHFRDKIGSIATAEQLVADRQLLKVALGAFGLDDDINNRFFIRKVLEEGTLKEGTLALRLADPRYREFSAAFGFGDFTVPRSKLSDFPDKIISAYKTRSFETAVGQQSDALRLALNAERDVAQLAGRSSGEDTKWFSVMGSEPLRRVFETALGLPRSFAAIDLDQQLGVLKEKTARIFGRDTVSQFAEAGQMEKLVRLYLLRSEAASGADATGGAAALQLLQSGRQAGAANILSILRR